MATKLPPIDESLVDGPVSRRLICPICVNILCNAVICDNGHTFCDHCLATWLSNHDSCPQDRRPLKVESIKPNYAVRGIVEDLVLKECPNHCASGWKGSVEALDSHIGSSCPNTLISCPHERCKAQVQRRQLSSHVQVCIHRPITCQHCQHVSFSAKSGEAHLQVCPLFPVACPAGGKNCKQLRRNDVDSHLDNGCGWVEVPCTYAKFGCEERVKRNGLQAHLVRPESLAFHLGLVASMFDSQERRCAAQEKQIAEQAKKISTLEAEIRSPVDYRSASLSKAPEIKPKGPVIVSQTAAEKQPSIEPNFKPQGLGTSTKSSIVLDVKPWDDETDLNAMEAAIRSINIHGLTWGASRFVEIAYGIKKMQIMATVIDELVAGDDIEDAVTGFYDLVQSMDIDSWKAI